MGNTIVIPWAITLLTDLYYFRLRASFNGP